MLQSAWRIKQAKSRVHGLKKARDDEIRRKQEEEARRLAEEARKLANATSVIAKIFLRLVMRLRVRRNVAQYPQIFRVTVHKAVELAAADLTGTSDPYVIVAGVNTQSGTTVSSFKTKHKSMTLNPVWDEETYVCYVRKNDSIVLTVVDHDLVGAHDFLGQVTIPLTSAPTNSQVNPTGNSGNSSNARRDSKTGNGSGSSQAAHANIMKIFSGKAVTNTYDLVGYTTTVQDKTGAPIKIDSTDNPGKGKITVTIQLVSSFYAQCGPIMKQAATVLGGLMGRGRSADGYKRRFLMLLPHSLSYYDDEFSLEAPRNTLTSADIESISVTEPTTPKHDSKPEIHVNAHNAKESWQLTWVDGASQDMKTLWMNKFRRFVDDHRAVGGSSLSRTASAGVLRQSSGTVPTTPGASTATTPSAKKNKRGSVFGF
jgi:hypothetical protein